MKKPLSEYSEIILTLDAGGTNFVFSGVQGGKQITNELRLPSNADNLELCLETIFKGFETVLSETHNRAVAISFAFPGPADYQKGVIGKLENLPAFADGGVPLGPLLEEKFGLPVFINNDGDLFAYGEAISGFLPLLNKELEIAGNPKRFNNLIGLTLGTGFGAGIVNSNGLHLGDNSAGAEIFLLRGFLNTGSKIEEEVSIRGIKRFFSEEAKIPFEETPSPKEIFEIGTGLKSGNKTAAKIAFEKFGKCVGEATANIVTLIDAPVVIGGGISNAYPLFIEPLLSQMNGSFLLTEGKKENRLIHKVFDFENKSSRKEFLKDESRKIKLPGSAKEVLYNPVAKICVGTSKLGTSRAIMLGAYAFAIQKLERMEKIG